MKYYRLILVLITLVAFSFQMLHGNGVGSYAMSNAANHALSFCVNTNLPKTETIDYSKAKAVEISCNTSISLFFLPIYFSWKPIVLNDSKLSFTVYKNIKEQLYITKLLEPPRGLGILV